MKGRTNFPEGQPLSPRATKRIAELQAQQCHLEEDFQAQMCRLEAEIQQLVHQPPKSKGKPKAPFDDDLRLLAARIAFILESQGWEFGCMLDAGDGDVVEKLNERALKEVLRILRLVQRDYNSLPDYIEAFKKPIPWEVLDILILVNKHQRLQLTTCDVANSLFYLGHVGEDIAHELYGCSVEFLMRSEKGVNNEMRNRFLSDIKRRMSLHAEAGNLIATDDTAIPSAKNPYMREKKCPVWRKPWGHAVNDENLPF